MSKKRILILGLMILAVGLIVGLVLASCGSSSTTTTAGGTATTAAAAGNFAGTITIGAVNSETGGDAMTGAEQKWAYEQAAKDINAKGGIDVGGKKYQLAIKFADTQSTDTGASAAMEQLIKVDGLNLILSADVTPRNLAALTVSEKYQKFFMINTSFTDVIAAQKPKMAADCFFTPASSGLVPFQMVAKMAPADKPTKWGMLTEDNQDGQNMLGGVKSAIATFNMSLAESEAVVPGAKDYSSAILKFKQNGIDGLVVLIDPADGITFVKQMKEQNYSPKFIFAWKGFWPTEFMTALGADSDYIGHDGFWSEQNGYPGSKELGQAFKDAHNGLSSVSIGLPYATVEILAQAISAAGGADDPAKVRDQIWGHTFKGTTEGDITYDATGFAHSPANGLIWLNKVRVQIIPDIGNPMPAFVPWDKR